MVYRKTYSYFVLNVPYTYFLRNKPLDIEQMVMYSILQYTHTSYQVIPFIVLETDTFVILIIALYLCMPHIVCDV